MCIDPNNEAPKVAHTPGPWVRDQYGSIKARGETLRVNGVSLPCGGKPADFDEVEANARLIAAAPELLEELRYLVRVAEAAMRAANRDGGEYDIDEMLEAARAAIAKATGADQ